MTNSEYTLKAGFFDSMNGDRPYGAEDLNNLFASLIADGVIENYGNAFNVKAGTIYPGETEPTLNMSVRVLPGKAIFGGRWLINDTVLVMDFDAPPFAKKRCDAIIIKIDRSERTVSIAVKQGIPNDPGSDDPQDPSNIGWNYPVMEHSEFIDEYVIAYVKLPVNTVSISDSLIEMRIGIDEGADAGEEGKESTPISAALLTGATLSNYMTTLHDVYTKYMLDHWNYVADVNEKLERIYDEKSLVPVYADLERVSITVNDAHDLAQDAKDIARDSSETVGQLRDELRAAYETIDKLVAHVQTLEKKVYGKVQPW